MDSGEYDEIFRSYVDYPPAQHQPHQHQRQHQHQHYPSEYAGPVPGPASIYPAPVQQALMPVWDQPELQDVPMTDVPPATLNTHLLSDDPFMGAPPAQSYPPQTTPMHGSNPPYVNSMAPGFEATQDAPIQSYPTRSATLGSQHFPTRPLPAFGGPVPSPVQPMANASASEQTPKKSKKFIPNFNFFGSRSSHQPRPKSPEPLTRRPTMLPATMTAGQRRARLPEESTEVLKAIFELDKDPDQKELESIAQMANVSVKTVKTWFNNRRSRASFHGK
jgi:hypothetical protein